MAHSAHMNVVTRTEVELCQINFKYSNIYIQQDAKLHILFYLETVLRVSGIIITHLQKRKQLYLQHLVFVTQLLLSGAIVEELGLV
jgi:hypothetical protein